jgi:hypothetical protein
MLEMFRGKWQGRGLLEIFVVEIQIIYSYSIVTIL